MTMQTNTKIRMALAQINTIVGDLDGNFQKIVQNINAAREAGCHLVAFPELAIPGYPPEDLVLRGEFIRDQKDILHKIADHVTNLVCVVGFVDDTDGNLYNSAAILQKGHIKAIYLTYHFGLTTLYIQRDQMSFS